MEFLNEIVTSAPQVIALLAAAVLIAVGVLVVVVNVIVEVIKKVTWDKIPTEILAVGVSFVITIIAVVVSCKFAAIALTWYIMVSSIVLSFFVAYAAMFGFDKFKDMVKKISN
ncbi:MAG: hypothetical protein VB018_04050 [Lachnospiraceae bacterium]|nr:hypothetical protein [Lachnospiraceae bacterium]